MGSKKYAQKESSRGKREGEHWEWMILRDFSFEKERKHAM